MMLTEQSTEKSNDSPDSSTADEETRKTFNQSQKIQNVGMAAAALESIRQAGAWENNARERDSRAAHAAAYPGTVDLGNGAGEPDGGDGVGDMYLGDYRQETHYHEAPKAAPVAPVAAAPETKQSGAGLQTLLKLAAGAGLGAAGMYPIAASLLADGAKDVVQEVTKQTEAAPATGTSSTARYRISLGPPSAAD